MFDLCKLICGIVTDLLRSRAMLQAEILLPRQQINVLRRPVVWSDRAPDRRMDRQSTDGGVSIGIRDRPTSPRTPWQNACAERLIGSIRRECIDHVVVFGERHLRHVLLSYMNYYNGTRTHLSLHKDASISRAAERVGRILCRPILGGLHHQYARI
jgi:transposase InsO family protein